MDNLYIDNLSGEEFEEYLLKLFEKLGYKGEVTQGSNDYGADLIVTRDNEKIVVQAKRYKNTVGISAVQEVIGAKKYYGATKTMVATNNYFTPNAIELAKFNNVELWDRDLLIQMAILSISPNSADYISPRNDGLDKAYNTEDTDDLLDTAIDSILDKEIASISYLQRSLRVGFNRASRLMDTLEGRGIVSSDAGSEPRRVLITREQYENQEMIHYEHTIMSGQEPIGKYPPRNVRLINTGEIKIRRKNNSKIIFALVIWEIFAITGILLNISTYSVLDIIITLLFALAPIALFVLKLKKDKKLSTDPTRKY